MPPSKRPFRRTTNSGRNNITSGLVRDRLGTDPLWQHYTSDGRWICPYCLKDLRAPRSGKSGLVHHIESHLGSRCASFKDGTGNTQSNDAIYDRLLSIYIEDQARANAAWQVFDHEGYWYSPTSLQRVPSVRIANGRFDSFTVQQMVAHLKTCSHFTAGTQYSAEQVQQARDSGIRISSLATNLQRVSTQNLWRYYIPQGWICPYCVGIVPQVQSGMNPGIALFQMASHLMQGCSVYPVDQRAIKSEAQLQQVLQQHQQPAANNHAPPIAAAAPVAQAPAAGHVPVAEQIPAAKPIADAVPVAQAAPAIPVAAPVQRTPSSPEIPTAAPIQRTPSGHIPVASPVADPSGRQSPPTAQSVTGSNAFSPTTNNLSSMNDSGRQRQTRSGGYSSISEDLDGMVDGFDGGDDGGLPSRSEDKKWVTSSTSRKTRTLSDSDPLISPPSQALESQIGDAFDAMEHGDNEPSIVPATGSFSASKTKVTEVPAATPLADDEDSGESNAFDWMDQEAEAADKEDSQSNQEIPINTDMIRAQGVQKKLMHACPKIPGYTFGTRYEACSQISGDFYEFLEREDGNIIFAEGDVSGHGVEAGLIMSMARKCLSIFARQGGSPAEVISSLNEALVDDLRGEKFITMCYGELNPTKREICWVRAGHNPVLRYNVHSKEFSEIKPGGMVVGMKSGKLFKQLMQEEVTQVQSGDVYLIYTDGFNETLNRQEEEYGFERMQHVIIDKAELGVEELLDHLMNSVRQFRGTTKADDDLTLLALAVD